MRAERAGDGSTAVTQPRRDTEWRPPATGQTPPAPATTPGDAVGPRRFALFDALAVRDFRLLWTGLVISNIGTWMQMIGQG
jgi:hypothetical protein